MSFVSSGNRLDGLGPYEISTMRQMAALWPPTAHLGLSVAAAGTPSGSNLPQAFEAVMEGKPVILLIRESPSFGHFILLHGRLTSSGREVELFDPLGTSGQQSSWEMYLDDPQHLNGGGLRPYLQALAEAGVPLSYNRPRNAPQEETANSCGLWCILRAALPSLSPSEFAKLLRDS